MFTSYSLPLSLSVSLSHSSSLLTPLFLLYSTRSARARLSEDLRLSRSAGVCFCSFD